MAPYFSPISSRGKKYENAFIRRKRKPFNDKRLFNVWSALDERLVSEQKSSIQQISSNSSQAAQFYRFFSNDRVSIEELIKMNCSVRTETLTNRHVLSMGDSSSFNLKSV